MEVVSAGVPALPFCRSLLSPAGPSAGRVLGPQQHPRDAPARGGDRSAGRGQEHRERAEGSRGAERTGDRNHSGAQGCPKPRGFGLSLQKEAGQRSTSVRLSVPPRFPPGFPGLSPAAAAAPVRPRQGRGPFKAGPWPRLSPAPRARLLHGNVSGLRGGSGDKTPRGTAAIGAREGAGPRRGAPCRSAP